MALIDQIDSVVYQAFQQNFISNYASQVSPGATYSPGADFDPPFEPSDIANTQSKINYPTPGSGINSPTRTLDRERSATVSTSIPNLNSPSNKAEAEKSIHQRPFRDSINSPTNRASAESVGSGFPSTQGPIPSPPPGPPPQNLGTFTSPWPARNNPTQVSQIPKHLPVGSDQFYGIDAGKNLYDSGPLSLVQGGPFSTPGIPAALSPVDAFATAHWLRNVGRELFGNVNFKDGVTTALVSAGASKGFQFVSSQILLAALNPKDPELGGGTIPGGILNAAWNPTSLLASAVPFVRPSDLTSITLGPVLDLKYDPTTSRIDKYIAGIKEIEKLTDGEPEDILGKAKVPRFLPSLFKKSNGFEMVRGIASVREAVRPKDTPQMLHARIVEAGDGDADGVIVDELNLPKDDIYMPLVFQDLRDKTETFLYFRAFIKPDSVTETFTPTWNVQSYYGRVDNVPVYMNTSRIIGFSFDVVAWQPADLPVVYRKLHKLQSMVYPFFDQQGFLSSGPIIRMRIGDLFSTTNNGKRGLPGYLTSLDFTYDNIWNIEKDFKIPRKATVSISFTALHEASPGTYPTSQNGKEFPTFGIGVKDGENYKGVETGLRGLLENVKSTREAKAKPATKPEQNKTSSGDTLPSTFEVDQGAGSAIG